MILKPLPESTIKLIGSSYTISSLETLVKELVENSIDANAKRIIINMRQYGLEKLEVSDDGFGIEDPSLICKRFATSKINDFDDILKVRTHGFRGQALHSICAMSNLSITTNYSAESTIGKTYVFDKSGDIVATTRCAFKQGTTVTVSNIFHNLPVRRQLYKSLFELQKSYSSITRQLKQLYLSKLQIQIKLCNDGKTDLNLPLCNSIDESIINVINPNKFKSLRQLKWFDDELNIKYHLYIPSLDINKSSFSNTEYKDVCHLFINNRPVEILSIFKAIREAYQTIANDKRSKYPLCFLFIETSTDTIDLNIDPDKRKVVLKYNLNICTNLKDKISKFYQDELEAIKSFEEFSKEVSKLPDDERGEKLIQTDKDDAIDYLQKVTETTGDNKVVEINSKLSNDEINENNKNLSKEFSHSDYGNDQRINYIHQIKAIELETDLSLFNTDNEKSLNSDKISNPSKRNIEINFNDENYRLGKLKGLESGPVENIGIKRKSTQLNDNKLQVCKKTKHDSNNIIKNVPNNNQLLTKSACIKPLYKNKTIENHQLPFKLCIWKSFIIVICEMKEIQIYSQLHLMAASLFEENIIDYQVPAIKLEEYITITQINNDEKDIYDELIKLPIQTISNTANNTKFNIISCPHILKNGFRIHSVELNDGDLPNEELEFRIVTVPSILFDKQLETTISELKDILINKQSIGFIHRPPIIKEHLWQESINTSKTRLLSSSVNSLDFWNIRYLRIINGHFDTINTLIPKLYNSVLPVYDIKL